MNKLGKKYEEMACRYLKEKGYKILDRNYTTKFGEIDIVASEKSGTVVFIEVKARKSSSYKPYEAVSKFKQDRIIKSSVIYIKSKNIKNRDLRYDVISISGSDDEFNIEHIKNAFNSEGYFI